MENANKDANVTLRIMIIGVSTRSTLPDVDKHGNRHSESRKAVDSEKSRVNSSEAGSESGSKLRYSLKGSCEWKKREALRPESNGISTALDHNTYDLVGISSLYDDKAEKHVAKLTFRLQDQMKRQIFDPMDLILMTGFLHKFRRACDKYGIHEKVSFWMFRTL